MPIRPENKHRYPANWDEIRKGILERAKHRCEGCGLFNGEIGYRDEKGVFHSKDWTYCQQDGQKPIRIVLTIAHLDHTPENCDPANLRAWCQQCHNRYDQPYRQKNRRERKERERAASAVVELQGMLEETGPVLFREKAFDSLDHNALLVSSSLLPARGGEVVHQYLISRAKFAELGRSGGRGSFLDTIRERSLYACLKREYEDQWTRLLERDPEQLFPWGLPPTVGELR